MTTSTPTADIPTTESTTADAVTAATPTTAGPRTLTVAGRPFKLPFADLMPPQSADERARLLADIRAHGVRVPVVVTENDELLDGHHRLAIAAELDLTDIPVEVKGGLTAEQKRAYAESVNLHRRHLSGDQVQAIIARHLTADPAQSDRAVAAKANVDHKTVGRARKKLVATGAVPQTTTTRGKDGRIRAVKKRAPSKRPGGTSGPAGTATGQRGKTKPPAKAPAAESPKPPKKRPPEADVEEDDIASLSWPDALHGVASDLHFLLTPLHKAGRLPASKRSGDVVRPLIARLHQIVADLTTVADGQDARNLVKAGKKAHS